MARENLRVTMTMKINSVPESWKPYLRISLASTDQLRASELMIAEGGAPCVESRFSSSHNAYGYKVGES